MQTVDFGNDVSDSLASRDKRPALVGDADHGESALGTGGGMETAFGSILL